jgi:hypothetical protein
VIDPNTGYDTGQLTDPTGRSVFGSNVCNQVPVDSVMANYIKDFLPLPNTGTNGFVEDPVASLQEDQFIFRYDYNISSKDTLSAFYVFDDQPQVFPFEVVKGASTGGDVPVGSGFTNAQRYQTGSISWIRTISPTMQNELRFSTNRVATFDAVPMDTTPPSALGFLTSTRTIQRVQRHQQWFSRGCIQPRTLPARTDQDSRRNFSVPGYFFLDQGTPRSEVWSRYPLDTEQLPLRLL